VTAGALADVVEQSALDQGLEKSSGNGGDQSMAPDREFLPKSIADPGGQSRRPRLSGAPNGLERSWCSPPKR